MGRIFYAWELGANLGHIGKFLPLARQLRSRGHAVVWAVAQTAQTARLLANEGFDWLQAPVCPECRREESPLSFGDILLRFGYADGSDLLGLVVAWRELMRLTGAQIVLADHAPTAILAARTLGIAVMHFTSGFFVPPRCRPLPNMRPWETIAEERLLEVEIRVLASINAVLERFGQPPLEAVAQLFDVAEDALLGFPELDPYASELSGRRYWGNLGDSGVGAAPVWPDGPGKRVFAYLRHDIPHHEEALAALRALGQPAIVFFPGATPALIGRYAAPHLVFSPVLIDMAQTARQADAAITYGSNQTTTSFLLMGKPLLLLPGQLEQYLLARRVEEMGAGLLVDPTLPADDMAGKLHRTLSEAGFTRNAQAFARRYAAFTQDFVIGNLVRRIEQLV